MSNDRIPVALKCAPKWWLRASTNKRAVAVHAALAEFRDASVYVEPWGVKVTAAVPALGALDAVITGTRRLHAAVEYACVDITDSVIDV